MSPETASSASKVEPPTENDVWSQWVLERMYPYLRRGAGRAVIAILGGELEDDV
jgi:hypothetical protein